MSVPCCVCLLVMCCVSREEMPCGFLLGNSEIVFRAILFCTEENNALQFAVYFLRQERKQKFHGGYIIKGREVRNARCIV